MSTISTGHAKKLIKNYVDNKIGKTISATETRAVWFSRKEIMNALDTDIHGITPDGLRFYFAAYETYSAGRPPKYNEDSAKITFVIIPTTHKIDETGHIVQHPYRTGEILHFDLTEDPGATPAYDAEFLETNDGQICPPPPVII